MEPAKAAHGETLHALLGRIRTLRRDDSFCLVFEEATPLAPATSGFRNNFPPMILQLRRPAPAVRRFRPYRCSPFVAGNGQIAPAPDTDKC